jgi:hypothetical protein
MRVLPASSIQLRIESVSPCSGQQSAGKRCLACLACTSRKGHFGFLDEEPVGLIVEVPIH